jgi:K+-transporting ATPase A subunit
MLRQIRHHSASASLAGSLASNRLYQRLATFWLVRSRGYAGWHCVIYDLTFFPVLVLGPILEQLMILEGRAS